MLLQAVVSLRHHVYTRSASEIHCRFWHSKRTQAASLWVAIHVSDALTSLPYSKAFLMSGSHPLGRTPKCQVSIVFTHMCLQHCLGKLTSCLASSHCTTDRLSPCIISSFSSWYISQKAKPRNSSVTYSQHILQTFHLFSIHITYLDACLSLAATVCSHLVGDYRSLQESGQAAMSFLSIPAPSLHLGHGRHLALLVRITEP